MSETFATQPPPLWDEGEHNFGYVPNPESTRAFLMELGASHPAVLSEAAPHWMGDGLAGDLRPYLSIYENEVLNPDGTVWKAKGKEPPYRAQTGNNCTSEGTSHGLDALQFMLASEGSAVVHRTCTEATYAFGLSAAGMRGDNGCYGSAMAKAARDIGAVSYKMVGGPHDEDGNRLRQYANNPDAVVAAFRDQAAAFRVPTVVQVTTREEYCAAIANRGVVIVGSNVGYNTPRDERGICERRGRWPHLMFHWGVIRSDGVETSVQFQSWGPNQPTGPTPFDLPTYAFRVRMEDALAQFSGGDAFALFGFPGFERRPLPSAWVSNQWL